MSPRRSLWNSPWQLIGHLAGGVLLLGCFWLIAGYIYVFGGH